MIFFDTVKPAKRAGVRFSQVMFMSIWPVNWYFGAKHFVRFRQVSALQHVRFRQILLKLLSPTAQFFLGKHYFENQGTSRIYNFDFTLSEFSRAPNNFAGPFLYLLTFYLRLRFSPWKPAIHFQILRCSPMNGGPLLFSAQCKLFVLNLRLNVQV